ncbi:MAG: hypothetical protein JO110_19300 [Acetobacteraceae bacterium]|nr:hypothetical protein [Acetobacteraceae bacterium]
MSDLPLAFIDHELPHRIRLRLLSRRGDAGFFANAVQRLSALPGIASAQANPRTGSLLIYREPTLQNLAEIARAQDLFEIRRAPSPKENPVGLPRKSRHSAAPNPLKIAAAGMAGLGAVQLVRGPIAGDAAEVFWQAYQVSRNLHRPVLATGLVCIGLVQLARGQVLGSATSLFYRALNAQAMAAQPKDAWPQRTEDGSVR